MPATTAPELTVGLLRPPNESSDAVMTIFPAVGTRVAVAPAKTSTPFACCTNGVLDDSRPLISVPTSCVPKPVESEPPPTAVTVTVGAVAGTSYATKHCMQNPPVVTNEPAALNVSPVAATVKPVTLAAALISATQTVFPNPNAAPGVPVCESTP